MKRYICDSSNDGRILENPVVVSAVSNPSLNLHHVTVKLCLTTETVECLSLTLQGIDDIHGGDGLTTGVFSVGDRITDDILEEDLEDSTGLFVDETGDTLDTATTSETADGGLGDALDVVTKDFAMTLGSSLSESFPSFSTA